MTVSAPIEPEAAPPAPRDTRHELADEFLRGSGIEIGALHLAMAMPEGALVRYVDRMKVADLRDHYPELTDLDLAPVDVVDDGELLTTFPEESVDFIIANHFLEHCEDPIRTIETHLSKLRPGGVLFYAVPDKRYTFDFRRSRTPLEHVVDDHENGPEGSRHEHYLEWQHLVNQPHLDADDPDLIARAAQLETEGYSIHFHVWTLADLVRMMVHCHERFANFEIEAVRRRSLENIVVLRKHGAPADWRPPAPAAPPPPVPAVDDGTPPSEGLRSALTGLLSELQAHSLLDIGCGQFGWMQGIALQLELYVGVDTSFDAILANRVEHGGPRRRFLVRDVTCDPLPRSEVVLCREVLGDLPDAEIARAVNGIRRSGARYLLATTGADGRLGPLSSPVDLLADPSGEPGGENRRLALWDLDAVRAQRNGDDDLDGHLRAR